MAISRTGTAIRKFLYNPRALTTMLMHAGEHNTVREIDGDLWCLLQTSTVNHNLYVSYDDGFTWTLVDFNGTVDLWSGGTHLPRSNSNHYVNGPTQAVCLASTWGNLFVFSIRWIVSAWKPYYAFRAIIDSTDASVDQLMGTWTGDVTTDGLAVFTNNKNTIFIQYVYSGNMKIRKFSPRSGAISVAYSETSLVYGNLFDSVADDDSNVYCIGNSVAAATNKVTFAKFTDSGSPSWASPVVIYTAPNTSVVMLDFAIAVDGYGNLCVVWGEIDAFPNSTTVILKYATSVNDGLNWNVVTVSNEAGWTPYRDDIEIGGGTKEYCTRTDVIGGSDGGFIITYTQDNASSVPKALVRQLTTADSGSTYVLQEQLEATNNPADAIIPGAKFFRVTEGGLMNLANPGLARIAYNVNEGNSGLQLSTIPTHVDQDILSIGPYPSTPPSEDSEWTVETAGVDELLVTFELVTGTGNNIDFYDEGYIGNHTTSYLSAFKNNGTSVRILRYEPTQKSIMGDRAGFDAPTEVWANIFIDPLNYKSPQEVQDSSKVTSYVEQDIRKVFIPPDLHLARSYILNDGNFLKRTVWILEFGGNEYELTQVVPRLINNQITHYDCNAYVVGPSYVPFSRTVLPSET